MKNKILEFLQVEMLAMTAQKFTKAGLKTIYFLLTMSVFVFGIFCCQVRAHSDGAPLGCVGSGVDKVVLLCAAPGNYTCGITACHYQYTIGSGKGKFMLFVLDTCKPGEIVDILVSFKQTDTDYHGFQIAAQDRYFNRLVGTFINVGDDDDTQVEAGGLYATHTKKGTKQRFWHVKWKAPPKDFSVANPVRFFAVGVEANNDGTSLGDYVYIANRTIVVKPERTKKEEVSLRKKE
jgi:hypothetical protein